MRQRPQLAPIALVASFAFSCSNGPPPSAASAQTTPPTPTSSTTAAVSPSSSTSTAVVPPLPAPVPSPLHVVAIRPGEIKLGHFDDGAIFATADTSFAIARETGELTYDAKWSLGLSTLGGGWHPAEMSFGGRFPENAWATDNWSGYARGTPGFSVFHFKATRWESVKNVDGPTAWFYDSFAAWKDGGDLALRLVGLPIGANPENPDQAYLAPKVVPHFEVVGKKGAAVPILAKGAAPWSFTALRSGEVLAVVAIGPSDKKVTKVQRWPAGDMQGVVEPLPGLAAELDDPVVSMSSASSAWVGGDVDDVAYFAHFDGKSWTKQDVPMKGGVLSMAEASDGTLWVIASATPKAVPELWKRAAAGTTFERIPLPMVRFADVGVDRMVFSSIGTSSWRTEKADAKSAATDWRLAPQHVVLAVDGEPFVSANADAPRFEDEDRSVLLRLKSVSTPLMLPSLGMLRLLVADFDDATVATGSKAATSCGGVLVTAGDVPEGAAADWDPVELRAAVKDLPPAPNPISAYEITMKGKRRLGFYAPSCDKDCGKWLDGLVTTLAKKLPAAKPKVYCRAPIATRELPFQIPGVPEKK